MIALGFVLLLQAEDPAADVAAILKGVKEIGAPGAPGTVAAWGARAFPVVTGMQGKDRAPVVAAARWEKGRVVILSHDGYLTAEAAKLADTGALLRNAIAWAGGPRVGLLSSNLEGRSLSGTGDLGTVDVLVLRRANLSDAEIEAVSRFVREGGGLVAALTGWGWIQGAGGKPVSANSLNRLLRPAGLGWTDDIAGKTGKAGFLADAVPPHCQGQKALEALTGAAAGDLRQAGTTVMNVVRLLPDGFPALDALLAQRAASLVPTLKKRLPPLDRVLLAYQLERLGDRPAAHPAAAEFPGAVPADAPLVSRRVAVDLAVHAWQSTGLYAAPGKAVTVEAPEGSKLSLRIGAHSDRLWHLDRWSRVPEISRTWPLRAKIEVASAFGGLIYIEGAGRAEVTIAGAVEAPFYVLGKSTDWAKVRAHPAPWAELATDKVILTVPSSEIRALDDPRPLLELWDRILDGAADLASIPRARRRPERFVADVQISAGYMHSGYPIMTHLDAAAPMSRLELMKKGQWGLVHELGHNHQSGDWTFEGTGEVTNNLFSVYLLETVCGVAHPDGHDGMRDREKKIAAHLAAGSPFAKWKDDPFLALAMYMQLQEAFGWDAFKKVFAEYRDLPRVQRPRNDDEKRDQWMVRFSRAAGKNLGPFFEKWGVPTSAAARDSLKELPAWSPFK